MRTNQEHLRCNLTGKLPVSVVIPALNAALCVEASIGAVAAAVAEVIVADGGSSDETMEIVARLGAQTFAAERGRGTQLAAGASRAASDWLLFLHADTCLQPGWREAVAGFIADRANWRKAACFRFRLDDASRQSRRLERLVAWRCRRFGLAYGDQGLLIRRDRYAEIGGFKPIPLMEDVDIVRRIGRRNMVVLKAEAVTSAARYRRDGYWRRSTRNLCLLSLYFAGVPPRWLVKAYG